MRIRDMNLIIDLLKEADPCFTDKKLFDLRKEKAIASLMYEISRYRLNFKIASKRYKYKNNKLYPQSNTQDKKEAGK